MLEPILGRSLNFLSKLSFLLVKRKGFPIGEYLLLILVKRVQFVNVAIN